MPGDVGMQFDAIVGTADDQVAIAPGALRRSWRENGRRYFHYASNAPIREDVQFFSGRYAVRASSATASMSRCSTTRRTTASSTP